MNFPPSGSARLSPFEALGRTEFYRQLIRQPHILDPALRWQYESLAFLETLWYHGVPSDTTSKALPSAWQRLQRIYLNVARLRNSLSQPNISVFSAMVTDGLAMP